jgi:hypothetical protein
MNWAAVAAEWAPYWAAPEQAAVSNASSQRGESSRALLLDWVMAQITAGVVTLPEFLSAPVQAQGS